jgi:hypothetical protein
MSGKSITGIDALSLYGCFRLAARIHDLRKKGYNIHEETITNNGKRYSKYSMPQTKLAQAYLLQA